MALLPLGLMIPILAIAGFKDASTMRIPNILSLLAVVLYIATLPLVGWQEAGLRLAVAAAVFIILFVLFAAGLFAGGDVKLMAALMLFVPSATLILFSYVFSGAMLIGILFVTLWQSVPQWSSPNWKASNAKGQFPMGISIALAGIIHFCILLFANVL